jgi:hypothetical protein
LLHSFNINDLQTTVVVHGGTYNLTQPYTTKPQNLTQPDTYAILVIS